MKPIQLLLTLIILASFGCQDSSSSSTSQSSDQTSSPNQEVVVEKASLARDPRLIGGSKSEIQESIEATQKKILSATENQIIGYWTGNFGKNKITLAISEAANGIASGHSICAGNYRPISGTMKDLGNGKYEFFLKEPGDDPYDGIFEFTVDLNSSSLSGRWTPWEERGNSTRQYTLNKRNFVYRTDVGEYPQASTKKLEYLDVENMLEEELSLMRNEIYARHGYSFKNKDMRYYFEQFDWYMPMGVDIRSQLTEIEAQNIDLIYEYESYYEEYYDDYGR